MHMVKEMLAVVESFRKRHRTVTESSSQSQTRQPFEYVNIQPQKRQPFERAEEISNERKRQKATEIAASSVPSDVSIASDETKEMLKKVIENQNLMMPKLVDLRADLNSIASKLAGSNKQIDSSYLVDFTKFDVSNLPSVTASVTNVATTSVLSIPKPKINGEGDKPLLIYKLFKENIPEITDDEVKKLVECVYEAAKDACTAFAIASDKGGVPYRELTDREKQNLFVIVGIKAKSRDKRCSIADKCSGLWAYEFAVQPKWSGKSKSTRDKRYVRTFITKERLSLINH